MRKIGYVLLFVICLLRSNSCYSQKVGVLYGMTQGGGTYLYGNIFSIDPTNDKNSSLFNFSRGLNGFNPYGNLIQDTNGLLYGMAYNQSAGWGTIFSFDPTKSQFTVLHVFADTDGAFPYGSLIRVKNGILYGMTYSGGANNYGNIFSFNVTTLKYTDLLNLNVMTGVSPYGNLMQASNGLLYGMTSDQDTTHGTLFSFDIASSSYTNQVYFHGSNGANPHGSLIQAYDGMLYGMTLKGGVSDSGVLFRYNTSSGLITIIANLTDSIGTYPYGSLIQGKDSNLYGMTSLGGINNKGTIFKYNITTGKITMVFSFNGVHGANPHGSLIQANDGLLYGMAMNGGKYNGGVVFEFNTVTQTEDTIMSFNGNNGATPYGDLLEVMSAVINKKDNVCYGDSSGSAGLDIRGGKYPLTYLWSNGDTIDSITGLKYGNYSVSIIDAMGKGQVLTFSITQPTLLKDSISSVTNVSCNGGSNGAVSVAVQGGTKPYAYLWSAGAGTKATASSLPAGTYTCTVTDSNGCITPVSATITQPTELKDSIASFANVKCNGGNSGSATVGVQGGTAPYMYSWSGGAGTNAMANNLIATGYTCTVTDSKGCVTPVSITITSPAALSAVTTYTATLCTKSQGSVNINVSGGVTPYTYLWSPGGGTNALDTALPSASYTCTINDSNNCTYTANVYLPNTGGPKDSILSFTNEPCYGDAKGGVIATVSSGKLPYTFSWSPSGGTDTVASGLSAGTYTLTATDSIGCTGTATVTITQPKQLKDSISMFTNVSCFGGSNGSAAVGVQGGVTPYSYLWSAGTGTTANVGSLVAGTYSCTITDSNNCVAPMQSVTITSPTALVVSDTSSTPTKCGRAYGTATIKISGGTFPYSYVWSPVSGSTDSISKLTAGTYSCTITDSLGCIIKSSVVVPDTGGPRDTIIPNTTIKCNGDNSGSAVVNILQGTAPYSYSWSPPEGTNGFALNLGAGTYTCTVTDSSGCKGQATITFTEPPKLTSVMKTTGVCYGSTSGGMASITVTGGTYPYAYSWNTGSTNDSIYNVAPGSYICKVTDSNNCAIYPACNITQAAKLKIDSIATGAASCAGCTDGWARVYVEGGIPSGDNTSYFYIWSNGATDTSAIYNLAGGSYNVCVTSPYGCGSVCDSGTVVTGIAAVSNINNSITIFPVPSRGQVYIQLPELDEAELVISNEIGDVIYSQAVNAYAPSNIVSINLNSLPDGIYIARIANSTGVFVKKIVLQK